MEANWKHKQNTNISQNCISIKSFAVYYLLSKHSIALTRAISHSLYNLLWPTKFMECTAHSWQHRTVSHRIGHASHPINISISVCGCGPHRKCAVRAAPPRTEPHRPARLPQWIADTDGAFALYVLPMYLICNCSSWNYVFNGNRIRKL